MGNADSGYGKKQLEIWMRVGKFDVRGLEKWLEDRGDLELYSALLGLRAAHRDEKLEFAQEIKG